jgi:Uma2 family endonuclease
MAEILYEITEIVEVPIPDVSNIVTEDDEPVDNLFSAKQQRLLVEPLYTSWKSDRPFVADANVGIYRSIHTPAIVPDAFLSLDVKIAEDWYAKEHRTYFLWEFGKPPEVVVEIVSNKKGQETGRKLREYALVGARYYAIYDPQQIVLDEPLQVYELVVGEFFPKDDTYLNKIGLGLKLWEGVFEEKHAWWLRWCDSEGNVLLTGAEKSEQERRRADEAEQRAEKAEQRAEEERQRAERERIGRERLIAQLQSLGIKPDTND